MRCPKCQAENREGRRFCADCGAPLALACPDCGFSNEPDERFCGGCGASLAASAGAPAVAEIPSEPQPVAPLGERRQVTILFADLTGYTKLSSELDPEETHDLLARFFEVVDGVVMSFGGTVDKHIGDSVMALFGAPVAHGDDQERALRAALEIHRAMPGLGQALGRPVRVHLGVASGEVVASGLGSASHREYTVTGDSVNLASRLGDAAGPGETLISDAVYRALANLLECEEVDDISVEGLDKPVRAWRLRAFRSDGREGAGPPFAGRRAELRQFAGAIEACRESGHGQAIYVRGEAGIGKTRLAREFNAIAAAQGFVSHTGLVLDFGVGKGQDAIRAIVRGLLGIPPGGDNTARQAAADEAFASGLLTADRRAFLNDLLDLPQATELRAMYDAMNTATRNRKQRETVAALITGASARQPVLLSVEDIHWADELTLGYLAAITQTVAECPAALVMTSRVEGDPLDQAWRGLTRGSPLMTIDLGPLRPDEAMALAGEIMDATSHFAKSCIERAEGNPLFLEQLLRSTEESAESGVPGSIQSLVLARMDNLEAADKQALQAASVIGQRFSLELLRHLTESTQYGCSGLIEHYLVRPEGEEFLFAHALIQEGVYSSLLKANKRELHRRAAEWFAERDLVLEAEHLDRAEDPAAARTYAEAARAQARLFRMERARELVERGLELADEKPDRFELLILQGEYLLGTGRPADSMAAYRKALEATDSEVEMCLAWIGLAAGMRVTDDYEEALAALDRAQDVAGPHGLHKELSRIHYYRGSLYFPLGNIDGCLEEHEKALDYARRAGSPEEEARALSGLGDADYLRGRMITAHGHFKRCIELCREHGFGRIEIANRYMVGVTLLYQNELEAALDDCLAAAEAAAKVGHHRAEIVARQVAGYVLFDMADLARAKEQCDQALALAQHLGAGRFEPLNLVHQGKVLALQGHRAEAVKLMEEAFAMSRESGITFSGPWVLGALAVVSDDPAARRRALSEGEDLLRQGCVSHNYFRFYVDAIATALELEDWDGADRYAAALEDYTRPEPLPWTDFFIAWGRALADHGRGKRDEATMAELRRLGDEVERVRLRAAWPALERALEAA